MSRTTITEDPHYVRDLLEESFAVMAAELPPAWDRFCASLDGSTVGLSIDEEQIAVKFSSGAAKTIDATSEMDARIETTNQAILDVLDNKTSLHEAVLNDRLKVKAELSLTVRLIEGILFYVHGGVRCPSFPAILARFRAGPERSRET